MSIQLHSLYADFAGLRRANLGQIDGIAADKRSIIPGGFNNNIFWQAGHLVTVQASLLYRRTGQPIPLPEKYFTYFGKGTSPKTFDHDTPPYEEVRNHLEQMIAVTKADLDRMAELPYSEPVTVSTGKVLNSFADGLLFLLVHEAYHLGSFMAFRKFL